MFDSSENRARNANRVPYPLRIALVAPLVTPIAPPFLGGAQALLHDLALGLAGLGHHVTLFAASGSRFAGGFEDGKSAGKPVLVEVPVKPGELREVGAEKSVRLDSEKV